MMAMAIFAFIYRRLASRKKHAAKRRDEKYRPEKHYMRGPGPKCRALELQQTQSSEASGTRQQS